MKKQCTLLILLGFFLPIIIFSQNDTLYSMKGNFLAGKFEGTDGKLVRFTIWKKKKEKLVAIHKMSVFSLKKANGEEIVFYEPDSMNGFPLSKQQMKSYLEGVRFAKKYYHNPFVPIAGLIAGAGGGYLGFWGLLLPTALVPLSSLPNPGVRQIDKRCPEMLGDPYFVKGFQSKARKKNLVNSLITGLPAFTIALVIRIFVK